MSKTVKTDPDEAKPAEAKPAVKPLGGIKNAPAVTNTGGFELRIAPARLIVAKMAGHNTGGFEARVVQEIGTH